MLAQYREAAAQLALAAPVQPLSADRSDRLRSRLVQRAETEGRGDAPAARSTRQAGATAPLPDDSGSAKPFGSRSDVTPLPRRFSGGGWLAAAASIVVLIGTLSLFIVQRRELQELRTRLADATVAQQSLASGMASRDSLIAALTGPQVEIVQLSATGDLAPSARMFWDRATSRWTLVGHDLGAPPEGRTYQLWLITTTSAAPISAGTFSPDSTGAAIHTATYPLARDALVAIAVSEEPSGGSDQPTTEPFLVGRARGE